MNVQSFVEDYITTLSKEIKNYIEKENITKDQIVSLNTWSNGSLHYGILMYE